MIVKRHLSLICELVDEYALTFDILLVKSDELTRVPQKWIARRSCSVNVVVSGDGITHKLHDLHYTHHLNR